MRAQTRIFHLTDIEGNLNAFSNAINKSTIVGCNEAFQLAFKKGQGTPYFIFGGDVQDRGSSDLKILNALVEFKEKYPEQVILLAGNRDITKNRLKIELDPRWIRERLLHGISPRWVPADKPTVPLDYVLNLMREKKGGETVCEETITNFINQLSIEQCQLVYLRWMFEKTMGCPNAFRYRREELSREFNKEVVTDEEVLANFLFETSPDGLSGRYLQLAQIAAIIPNSKVLAIHGGIKPTSLGRIPQHPVFFDDAQQWVKQFNQWYQEQITHWIDYKPTMLTVPACTALDESVLPIPGKNKFIITEDNLGGDREFVEIDTRVANYLTNNEINLVLTGHQPIGDHPAILRHSNLLFINGDTGYAKSDPKSPDDTRGATCHTLEIRANSEETQCCIKATLSDFTLVTTQLKINSQGILGDPYIGTILPGHGLVQCQLDKDHYRIAYQKGFNVSYQNLSLGELDARINKDPLAHFRS